MPSVASAGQVDLKPGRVFRDRLKSGIDGPEMVVIPAGRFRMGDIQGLSGKKDEQPVHEVDIKRPFAMGRYEITFGHYDEFAKATGRKLPNDRGWGRGSQPVIYVSWHDARNYAAWLSEQTSTRYRLPTEAEWEYVARAGTETAYWWGNDFTKGMANCAECGSKWDFEQAAPTGSFKPNPFGLYDTAGNVWEWVEDCWHENYIGAPGDGTARGKEDGGNCAKRVIRGGSYTRERDFLRSSYRWNSEDVGRHGMGFRLVRELE
jgi:formylglycine-generating enzyme required for sulfatase activity